MRCEIGTCRKQQPRTDDPGHGFCLWHTFMWQSSQETRAEFVARQEAQDVARGKKMRKTKEAA